MSLRGISNGELEISVFLEGIIRSRSDFAERTGRCLRHPNIGLVHRGCVNGQKEKAKGYSEGVL